MPIMSKFYSGNNGGMPEGMPGGMPGGMPNVDKSTNNGPSIDEVD